MAWLIDFICFVASATGTTTYQMSRYFDTTPFSIESSKDDPVTRVAQPIHGRLIADPQRQCRKKCEEDQGTNMHNERRTQQLTDTAHTEAARNKKQEIAAATNMKISSTLPSHVLLLAQQTQVDTRFITILDSVLKELPKAKLRHANKIRSADGTWTSNPIWNEIYAQSKKRPVATSAGSPAPKQRRRQRKGRS